MIEKLQVVHSQDVNPYFNLALEEFLLHHVAEDTVVLYLWQNEHTVVIGRNQNAWKECKVNALEDSQGHLVRRLSGGGAVYHDLGNLNFTFLANVAHYDIARQSNVILRALSYEGVMGEKSGRNDLLIDGKKFSGNAYYQSGNNAYHHGTLLVDVDLANMGQYLQVSQEKLKSNGVDSVRSRVMNLKEVIAHLTIGRMKENMIRAFEEEYGKPVAPWLLSQNDINELLLLMGRYESTNWKFRKYIKADFECMDRFAWGEFHLTLEIEEDRVRKCMITSDAIDVGLLQQIELVFLDAKFSGLTLSVLLEALKHSYNFEVIVDIQDLLLRNIE